MEVQELEQDDQRAADMAALEAMMQGEGEAHGMEGAEVITHDEVKEAALIINLLADGVQALYPMLHYPEDVREMGAQRLAPLMLKYGVSGGFLAEWGDEIAAGMFFGGVVLGSVQAVKQHNAAKKKDKTESQPEAPAQGGGGVGSFRTDANE